MQEKQNEWSTHQKFLNDTSNLLSRTFEHINRYIQNIANREVFPSESTLQLLREFEEQMPDKSTSQKEVIELLNRVGAPNTVASTGGQYYGFVIGGILPIALATSMLSSTWNQNAGMFVSSPVAGTLENISIKWLCELLGLPKSTYGSFVTGTTMANFTALCAARNFLLKHMGWNVEENGLWGAPRFSVIVGEEVHVSVIKALGMAGLGRSNVLKAKTDVNGKIITSRMPNPDGPRLICLQLGNVNSGACDPIREICESHKNDYTWVHIDGAFGLWASTCRSRKYLTDGLELADSWATDLHKWPNGAYDNGLVLVKKPEFLQKAMSMYAEYLPDSQEKPNPMDFTPEISRKARGIEAWSILKTLGKEGIDDLVEKSCILAQILADGLKKNKVRVLNEVVLNQVLIDFGSEQRTEKLVQKLQNEGKCWCGKTKWKGQSAMRISISSWVTDKSQINSLVDYIAELNKINV